MQRPSDMFDRVDEWEAIERYVADDTAGATLGVVSGRRRQGKSFLLQAFCEASGGFYFAATEAATDESLRQLGTEVAEFTGASAPLHLSTWDQAVDVLLALGRDRPVPVVIDEFPYLCKSAPALPSIIQKAFGPRRPQRTQSRTRLLLCGSAMSFMGRLLSGAAPLRGRAGLDLTVSTFDYRLAAQFWGLTDWRTAVRVHAIVGGTPAYRREYVQNDTPRSAKDFDAWVVRTVLDPRTPLFKEARFLLAEEADLRDRALYHSVLGAVAEGHQTRGGIAGYVGRPSDTLGHPLAVLEDAGFLVREEDAFHPSRARYRIAEPLISFYHAVMRPMWGRLERPGRAAQVWRDSQDRFAAQVLGPHFERLARVWLQDFADSSTLDGSPVHVLDGVVNDPAARRTHQVDAVALGPGERRARTVLALGEAKWGEVMGLAHLRRLQRVRALLAARSDVDVADARLVCFSGAGFTDELRDAAERADMEANSDVVLVDLERLYQGT